MMEFIIQVSDEGDWTEGFSVKVNVESPESQVDDDYDWDKDPETLVCESASTDLLGRLRAVAQEWAREMKQEYGTGVSGGTSGER